MPTPSKLNYENILKEIVEVSNDGVIRWRKNGKVCTHHYTGEGYKVIRWQSGGGKMRCAYVSRLLATALIPNPKNLPYVQFVDNDKENVVPGNLRWAASRKHSMNYLGWEHLDSVKEQAIAVKTEEDALALLDRIVRILRPSFER
jgi:hypothetical protein